MAEFPAFPLWTDAYLGDTGHLTTLEHGAYLLLLMAMWRTAEKRLPHDDVRLARIARLTQGQWRRIRPVIMEFFKADGGYITQGRLTDEAILVRQKSQSQSFNSKARWLKSKQTGDANASIPHSQGNPPTPTTISTNVDIGRTQNIDAGEGREKPERPRKGFRLPETWKATEAHRREARAKGLTYAETESEIKKFKDHFTVGNGRNKTYSDWDRAFSNWCQNAIEFAGRSRPVGASQVRSFGGEPPRKLVIPTKDTPPSELRYPGKPWYDDDNQPDYAEMQARGLVPPKAVGDGEW